ncbi:MAG TPA: PIG-L deacetylase family protein [Nocardioidaceae bacterium]|nr:PIG-L deacetylase family protein [Nocardioidaceae bacterium]
MRVIPKEGELAQVSRVVLAPHADDEVLGCGGLLAKYPEECTVVVLATPDDVRAKELERARDVLAYRQIILLDLPDGSVGDNMRELVGQLDWVLNVCRPEELYLPYPSVHQDHVATYEAGMRSARLSMNSSHWFPPSVLVYDVAAYDVELYPTDLRWNVFESLNETQVDKKVEAVAAYASQQVEGPHPLNGVKEAAHALGSARQVAWAEHYALVRAVRTNRGIPVAQTPAVAPA